jgi:hypothetical protein
MLLWNWIDIVVLPAAARWRREGGCICEKATYKYTQYSFTQYPYTTRIFTVPHAHGTVPSLNINTTIEENYKSKNNTSDSTPYK